MRHSNRLARLSAALAAIERTSEQAAALEAELTGAVPQLQAAAQHDHIFCKLSGMITEADWANWKPADLKPYVEAALETFGPDRCMYGSDWPVCELAGSYEQVHGALTEVLGPLSDDETHAIFEGTARRFYGIST